MLGMRFSHDEMSLYLSAGVLVGLGQAGTTFPVILPVVARVVPAAYRSTAMGIASAGGSLGQFAVVPTGQLLISQMDWTGALWMLRSEEHTSELQSLMRISYAVFCLKKKK